MGLAMADEEDSRDTEEEGKDGDPIAAEEDTPDAPLSTTTATAIPTDTVDMMTYEVPSDDATVDSTVVEEEREVLVADSSSSSPDVDDGDKEQVGDHPKSWTNHFRKSTKTD